MEVIGSLMGTDPLHDKVSHIGEILVVSAEVWSNRPQTSDDGCCIWENIPAMHGNPENLFWFK
jgi:hypothetical protein